MTKNSKIINIEYWYHGRQCKKTFIYTFFYTILLGFETELAVIPDNIKSVQITESDCEVTLKD